MSSRVEVSRGQVASYWDVQANVVRHRSITILTFLYEIHIFPYQKRGDNIHYMWYKQYDHC